MKLLVPFLAAAGLSGCVAYGGDPYYGGSPIYSTSPYTSSGPVYYGHPVPYVVPAPPAYTHGRGMHHRRHWGQRDRDRDGIPNRFDRDRDGDGVPNRYDARPNNPRRH